MQWCQTPGDINLLLLYVNDYTSHGDSEHYRFIQSYRTIGQKRYIVTSFGKFDFQLHYSSDGLYIAFYFQPLRMLW